MFQDSKFNTGKASKMIGNLKVYFKTLRSEGHFLNIILKSKKLSVDM